MSETNKENLNNYKGIYFNDHNVQHYYECGSHFCFKDLCGKLEKLIVTLSPERRGKTLYEDGEEFESKEINSVERTKAESRKFGSDNSKCTLSAPKSVNKDFVSPDSKKSGLSLQTKEVNINELRGSFHKKHDSTIKRINISQNKNLNNSLAKPCTAKLATLINSTQEIRQYFKKVTPKIIQTDMSKNKETNNRFLQVNNANRNNKTLIQEMNEKTIHQERLFKKIQQKSIIYPKKNTLNFSSFSKNTVTKINSHSRKPSPFIQKGINDSNVLQKSFFKEKTKQNDKIILKNCSIPSDVTNIIDSSSIIKSQIIEKSFVNVKSRNINRNNNKLEADKSTFKDKISIRLNTVDNNSVLNHKKKDSFINNLKQHPLSQEKPALNHKKINNMTYHIKNPNKLVKTINSKLQSDVYNNECINSSKNKDQINCINKVKSQFNSNLREKEKKNTIDSNAIVRIQDSQHSRSKNISHHSFLSKYRINKDNTKRNIISFNDKKVLVFKGNETNKTNMLNNQVHCIISKK